MRALSMIEYIYEEQGRVPAKELRLNPPRNSPPILYYQLTLNMIKPKPILVASNFYITVEQKTLLEKIAQERDVTASIIIRDLIEEHIK